MIKNYLILALYDEGFGGFNYISDIDKISLNEAKQICYYINDVRWKNFHCPKTTNKMWREFMLNFNKEHPNIETVIWVSNDTIYYFNFNTMSWRNN